MSKRSLIDGIEIKNPCSQNWEEMQGSERVRFCEHCATEVNDLSTMTRKEAMKLVRRSNGRLCVRFVKNPVNNQPVFASKLHQITRRAAFAAGVLSASLSLSTLAYAQGSPVLLKRNVDSQTNVLREKDDEKDKIENGAGSVTGTVADSNGAAIPNATVTLLGQDVAVNRTVVANADGFYEIAGVAPGKYTLIGEYAGFKKNSAEITVTPDDRAVADITLDVGNLIITAGELAVVEYSGSLHKAVSEDNLAEVKNLIMRGENVNFRDENYNRITPLFLAVENGNAEIAQTLLDFGAKANSRDDERQTALMRLDDDATPELVRILIKHGAKVDLADRAGNTALILAARYAKPEILEILIGEGADVNARNKTGRTALMEAAEADNPENVRALLLARADVDLKDKDGESARALTSSEEVVKLLESFGAASAEDPN